MCSGVSNQGHQLKDLYILQKSVLVFVTLVNVQNVVHLLPYSNESSAQINDKYILSYALALSCDSFAEIVRGISMNCKKKVIFEVFQSLSSKKFLTTDA